MRLIDADRLLSERMKSKYYHLPNGDIAIPIIDIEHAPTIEERKTGKWLEKHHAYSDEEMPIEEWQSAKCSVCGKYHTTPYLYYFTEYSFCPSCGAKMEGTE